MLPYLYKKGDKKMAWIPAIMIEAGTLAGPTPAGTLEDLVHYFSSITEENAGCKARQERTSSEDPYVTWRGAYGSDGFRVTDVAPTADRNLLAEIEVNKKETAAFWKQTICLYGKATKTHRTSGDNEFDEYGLYLDGFTRKVYQHPGDTVPISEETLYQVTSGMHYITGNIGDEARYNPYYRRIYYGFGWIEVQNTWYWGCVVYATLQTQMSGVNVRDSNRAYLLAVKQSQLLNRFDVDDFVPKKKDDPNDDENNKGDEEGGGDSEHNRPVDPVPIPDPINDHTAIGAGFITVYAPATQLMRTFAEDMYASNVWEAIKLFFGSPMDFIVGCLSIPYTPEIENSYYPKFGVTTFPHALPAVAKQYTQLDFGSIHIEPYGNNCFDFTPYTKIQIWLPFIGYRELNVDEVMGKNIHVKYTCDCVSGACVAFISTQVKPQGLAPFAEVVIAQYEGNCGVQIPVGQVGFDNFIRTSIEGTVSGVVGVAQTVMGGEGNVDKAVSQLTSTTVGKITGLKPTVERSGSIASSPGFSSVQYPYIIRTFPKQSLPSNYRELLGYPSNIGGTLNDGFEGYAVVDEIQLNNIPAMEPERAEIVELLKGGVII